MIINYTLERNQINNLVVFLLIYHTFISPSLIFQVFGFSNMAMLSVNIIPIIIIITGYKRKINNWAAILF